MVKQNLASMSVEALFKLRDDVAEAIANRATELRRQLSQLTGVKPARGAGQRKGRKVAPKYRSKKDPSMLWSGRGALPRWMKEEMKGTKLKKESFLIKA